MFRVLLSAVMTGMLTAGAVALYAWCVRPSLASHRARPLAFVLTALAAATVPLTMALAIVVPTSPLPMVIAFVVLWMAWIRPAVIVRITGGPRALPDAVLPLWARSVRIEELLDVGALDEAAREVDAAAAERTAATDRLIGLLRRRVAEEEGRRAGHRISSRATTRELADEWRSVLAGPAGRARPPAQVLVGLAAIIGFTSTLSGYRACVAVEAMIITGPGPVAGGTLPLGEALPSQIEDGAVLLFDDTFGLDAAAESRSDPDARRQLVEAGFVSSRVRDWTAADGMLIQADVFEFADAEGALAFQHAVNRYACQFATHAFRAPLGGIGLQVRRAAGDPIEEQVSWVVGSRRYLVSHRAEEVPDDHARIMRLFRRAEAGSRS